MKVAAGVRFAIIPEWVLDADISPQAVRLYGVLARYADVEGLAERSRRQIAARMHCSRKTVDRALVELEDVGAVVVDRARWTASGDQDQNLYQLVTTGPEVGQGRAKDVPTCGDILGPTGRAKDVPLRTESLRTRKQVLKRRATARTDKASANGTDPRVSELVAYYVDQAKAAGIEPISEWRARVGRDLKKLLASGKEEKLLKVALKAVAKENRPGSLAYVVADIERDGAEIRRANAKA